MSKTKEIKTVVCHSGIFHSDELTAIALLKVFKPECEFIVNRLPHQTSIDELDKYDYIIDIGRKYDGVKYFDHHQNNPKDDNKASAGLIFDYLELNCIEYLDIEAFVYQVDANDLGLEKPNDHSIISFIKSLNTTDIYSKEQDKAFMFALDILTKYIQSLKNQGDVRAEAYNKLYSCEQIDNIVISQEFIPEWQYALVGTEIDYFMWFDKDQNTWKIQSVPVEYGSFEFRKPLEPSKKNEECTFVHNGKFFAVGTKDGLLKLVKDSK